MMKARMTRERLKEMMIIKIKPMFKAQSYMKPVRQWAIANGVPFFTWKEQRMALAQYEIFRAGLN